MKFKNVLVVILFSVTMAVSAQEEPKSVADSSKLSLGVGAAFASKIYKGQDDSVYPVPMIYFEKDNFYFKGKTAGYQLFKEGALSFDLIAQWRFDGYEEDDSDYLDGMHRRKMTIEAGGKLSYFDGWGTAGISFVNDVLGRHDGSEAVLNYEKRFRINEKFSIIPSLGIAYQSNNLSDYYYGVRRDEVRAGRAKYVVGDSYNPFIGFSANHKLNDKWSLILNTQFTMFDDEITDSPIVDKDYSVFIMAGATYKF